MQSNHLQTELEFCFRLMVLRQRVIRLSTEEGTPFQRPLVQNRFFHALFTGLKHNNIRMELQSVLKQGLLTDELLQEISLASAAELEHIDKVKT